MNSYNSNRGPPTYHQERKPYPEGGQRYPQQDRERPTNHYGHAEKENFYQTTNGETRYGGEYPKIETKLLPNEMRISSQGDMRGYVDHALGVINQGFNHVKMVGRGQAVPLTEDLVDILQKKAPSCMFQVRFTTALNKLGDVCDEVHVMMSKKSAQVESKYQSGGNNYNQRPLQGNYHSLHHIAIESSYQSQRPDYDRRPPREREFESRQGGGPSRFSDEKPYYQRSGRGGDYPRGPGEDQRRGGYRSSAERIRRSNTPP
jgi:hypothetical protein